MSITNSPYDFSVLRKQISYIKNKQKIERIKKAFNFMKKWHENQFRANGEPYYTHPFNVALILASIKANEELIIVGLLHDILEDTECSDLDIEKAFNKSIVDKVKKLSKIERFRADFKGKYDPLYIQKLILGIASDPSTIVVKLADRLHNMQTLSFKSPPKQQKIAKETMDIYAPIASILGIHKFKAELEDLSFAYLNPEGYRMVANLIKDSPKLNDKYLKQVINSISNFLIKTHHFKDIYLIEGRIKHLYSIYSKMEYEDYKFSEILDLIAIRIVTKSKTKCYEILGELHQKYPPLAHRFKDYIAVPKSNNYQSLHSTIIYDKGTIEIQIRDKEMHELASYGTAAHFIYKEHKPTKKKETYSLKVFEYIQKQIEQIQEISDKQKRIVDDISHDIFSAKVSVMTPKGHIHQLPQGSTALDFAFLVHSDIGRHAKQAIINGRPMPLSTQIKQGDLVEIVIDQTSILKPETINWVKTKYAKDNIKKILVERQKLDKSIQIAYAKQLVNEYIEKFPIWKELFEKEEKTKKLSQLFKLKDINSLYLKIANGYITVEELIENYQYSKFNDINPNMNDILIGNYQKIKSDLELFNPLFRTNIVLSPCCQPVFQDEVKIILFNNKNDHNKIGKSYLHRIHCDALLELEQRDDVKVFNINWKKTKQSNFLYPTTLFIKVFNLGNVIFTICKLINEQETKIYFIEGYALNEKSFAKIIVGVNVENLKELTNLIRKMSNNVVVDKINRKDTIN